MFAAAWLLEGGEEVGDLVELLVPQVLERGHDAGSRPQRAQDRVARDAGADLGQIRTEGPVAVVADLVAGKAARLGDNLLARLVLRRDVEVDLRWRAGVRS